MPIIDLQYRIAERGRIRIGVQATTRSGKRAPRKLDRFRFTSADRGAIEQVARLYGGTPAPWDNGGHAQFEVISEARSIPIVLPPEDMAFSQFYESWAKGFCTRRCDGRWDTVRDSACDCDPEARECKTTTRLSVILPEVPGLGTWRLETHGYYAAVELGGALAIIAREAARGRLIPARLLLVEREVRRLVSGKAEVRQFVVPMIDVDLDALPAASSAAAELAAPVAAVGAGETPAPAPAPAPSRWRPVDAQALPAGPEISVADQLAEVDPATRPARKARKNAAAPIRPTGRRPRPAAAVAPPATDTPAEGGPVCQVCDGPLAGHPVTRHGPGWAHKTCPEPPPGSGGPGRGGTSTGTARSHAAGEPAPTATIPDFPEFDVDDDDAMSDAQRRMLFALATDVFPDHSDDERRTELLALAHVLGAPGLTSRTQINHGTASALIDTLQRLDTGEAEWIDGKIILVTEPGPFDHDGVSDSGAP